MTGRLSYSAEDLALLVECGTQLAAATAIGEIAPLVCRHARSLTAADGAAFIVRDGDDVLYVDDETVRPLWKGKKLALDDCMSGWVLRNARTVAVADIESEPRVPFEQYRGTFVESFAMAPIGTPEPTAVVAAYWGDVGGPSPRTVALLEALAAFAAVALENVRRATAELEARRRAEAESAAKDEFVAMLGHELRNPLAPIVTVMSLVKLRGADPFEREHQIIDRQIGNIVRLVEDMLDVSRIARGAIHLRRTPIELSWIVTRSLELCASVIADRAHELHVDVPATGLAIDVDVDRFTQIVTNLVANAARYTPRGGRIDVTADVEGTDARLVVRDTGVGLDATRLPHVFELYARDRWRSTQRDRDGGLGLGLSLVRGLVELHGGVVSAASEGPGRGTTFTIRVPLFVTNRDASGDRYASVRLDSSGGSHARGTRTLRVLVVDDNVDAAETLGDLLSVMGHDATVVHDGPAALETLATLKPDIAFLDIGLPVFDGYELAARIRALPGLAEAPLVAVTGYGEQADRDRSRSAGFAEHLLKPLSADKLRAVIGKLSHGP